MNNELLLIGNEKLDTLNLFKPSALVSIASIPGIGKSTFSLKLLSDIIKTNHISALLFNLENSKIHIEKKLIEQNQEDMEKLNLTIYDNPNMDINKITRIIKEEVKKSDIKLVVIDYIQLISSDIKNKVEAISDISRKLKVLALELNICVICLSELSRFTDERENNEPRLSDIRSAGSLVQDSDVIMYLYIDNTNTRNLKIAKNRWGSLKTLPLDMIMNEKIQMSNLDINRFIEAHKEDYERALNEIKNGRKQTHWMWYIFPQIAGLGRSDIAKYYEIKSLNEARLYLNNELLRSHLIEITSVLLELNTNDPIEIFGDIDALKLKSSMTLFSYISDNGIFNDVIYKYFNGNKDLETIRICEGMKSKERSD